jgi:hypothetical protein
MSKLLKGIAWHRDAYDIFGFCQEWRFAISDVLVWDMGESVPGFRSMGPETDSYAYNWLRDQDAKADDLRYALRILDRYREWIRIAGRDY